LGGDIHFEPDLERKNHVKMVFTLPVEKINDEWKGAALLRDNVKGGGLFRPRGRRETRPAEERTLRDCKVLSSKASIDIENNERMEIEWLLD